MNPCGYRSDARQGGTAPLRPRGPAQVLRLFAAMMCVVALAGCTVIRRPAPPPSRTTISSPLVELPAQRIGNYLVIEARWDRNGPYHFLIDTGSSVTLLTPELVRRYPSRLAPGVDAPRVRVTGADGKITELPPAAVRRIDLGGAYFDDVPVLMYDCAPLSAHLGVKIDGVLGFPLFRQVLLTLDYPGSRVYLRPAKNAAYIPGSVVAFDDGFKTPVIHIGLGNRSLLALIDSGSDSTLSLNPAGLDLKYAVPPRPGATVGTLAGDHVQQIGRIDETLAIGGYTLAQPITETTDELSTIGGGVLRHFAVTFDQSHDRVTFFRDSTESIRTSALRSAGVSFSKTPAYWKIAGVVRDSPAAAADIRLGDLVTRINGEPIARWDLRRYEALVASENEITFTFLTGTTEVEKRVRVFELVP